ncbi:O-antigen ligase family protein [Clostridium perfringens]|nr:O-antigen ligase family protein [Clostridium perfringens]
MSLNKTNLIKKNKNIYYWSIFYILVICIFSIFFSESNIIIFFIYAFMAIPFIKHVDKYAMICFVLSTLSYYFNGASEGVFSIYTIFLILVIFEAYLKKRFKIGYILPLMLLIFCVYLSYTHSQFNYISGATIMLYNLFTAIVICCCLRIDADTINEFLPFVASIIVIFYFIVNLSIGFHDGFGITISKSVNHNSFGNSVSQLAVILSTKVLLSNGKNIYYRVVWIISFITTLMSGSRNALLGAVIVTVLIYIYKRKIQGKVISGVIKFIIITSIIIFIAIILMPKFGIDLSRYNYVKLISSGGTNRTELWKALVPVIIEKYNMFGYGPGHGCSKEIILPLINRAYAHTHNTFIECWGELGLVGLTPFLWLVIYTIKKSIKDSIKYPNRVLFCFLFIEVLIIGMSESLFEKIWLWMLIAFILSKNGRVFININR